LSFALCSPPPRSSQDVAACHGALSRHMTVHVASGGKGDEDDDEVGRRNSMDRIEAQRDPYNNDSSHFAVRAEIRSTYELVAFLVAALTKVVLRFGVAALQVRHRMLQNIIDGEGGKAVLNFVDRLRARGTLVRIFGEDRRNAWVFKERDLDEVVEEAGRCLLQWACRAADQKFHVAKDGMSETRSMLQSLESRMFQLALNKDSVNARFLSQLISAIADRGHDHLFELDRLNRVMNELSAAAFEVEHRLGADIRSGVLDELGTLDTELVKMRRRLREYKGGMVQQLQEGLRSLKGELLQKLKSMSRTNYALQLKVKALQQDDPAWRTEETGDAPVAAVFQRKDVDGQSGRASANLSSMQAASLGRKSSAQGSVVDHRPAGGDSLASAHSPALRAQVQVVSASGLVPPQPPIETLHEEVHHLKQLITRMQTLCRLKFHDLRQDLENQLQKIASKLSSNSELWEHVSEVRERQRLVEEELSTAVERDEATSSAIENLNGNMKEVRDACKRLGIKKERMWKKQGGLEREMSKYEGRNALDVRKMQADIARLNAKVFQSTHAAPVDEHIDAHAKKNHNQQHQLRRQMKKEEHLTQKALAKAQLIRQELETGEVTDDEALLVLLNQDHQSVLARVTELETANRELRGILEGGGYRTQRATRPPRPGASGAPAAAGGPFEEKLCYSVGFMWTAQSPRNQNPIDQTRTGGTLPDLVRPSSEPREKEQPAHALRSARSHLVSEAAAVAESIESFRKAQESMTRYTASSSPRRRNQAGASVLRSNSTDASQAPVSVTQQPSASGTAGKLMRP